MGLSAGWSVSGEHLLGSIGNPAIGVDLKLCDDTGQEVPDGEVGEIATRADAVMDGYPGRLPGVAATVRGRHRRMPAAR